MRSTSGCARNVDGGRAYSRARAIFGSVRVRHRENVRHAGSRAECEVAETGVYAGRAAFACQRRTWQT